jgi:hypothetical protein
MALFDSRRSSQQSMAHWALWRHDAGGARALGTHVAIRMLALVTPFLRR